LLFPQGIAGFARQIVEGRRDAREVRA